MDLTVGEGASKQEGEGEAELSRHRAGNDNKAKRWGSMCNKSGERGKLGASVLPACGGKGGKKSDAPVLSEARKGKNRGGEQAASQKKETSF